MDSQRRLAYSAASEDLSDAANRQQGTQRDYNPLLQCMRQPDPGPMVDHQVHAQYAVPVHALCVKYCQAAHLLLAIWLCAARAAYFPWFPFSRRRDLLRYFL